MNYQSFLSVILQNKYYTQCKYVLMLEEISELSLTIQRKTGLKILSKKLPQEQIFLYCPNSQFCGCSFSHRFKRVKVDKEVLKFQLVQSIEKHSIECQELRNGKKSRQKIDILDKDIKSSNLIQSIEIQSAVETCVNSPMSKQSICNMIKQKSMIQNIQKRLYRQEQFSLLKKQLQLKSKGLLSKSTQFQEQTNSNTIKKIQFHCKFQPSCPYKSILILNNNQLSINTNQSINKNQLLTNKNQHSINKNQLLTNKNQHSINKNQLLTNKQSTIKSFNNQQNIKSPIKLNQTTTKYNNQTILNKICYYSLSIINQNHLPQCILQDQIIHYNQNTMTIDKQIDLLTKIIQQNSQKLKPKEILKKLADQLGQQQQFIYNGLDKKINKRAIKKYFDNCVAKVRSKIFPLLSNKINKTSSSIHYQSATKVKKDQDYIAGK